MIASALRRRMSSFLAPQGTTQWARVVMNREVSDFLTSIKPAGKAALEVSGEAHAARGWRSYASLRYPEFDLCVTLQPDVAQYDVVIAEQVLEHVEDPVVAFGNLVKLTVPGGWVVVTTPFLVRLHHEPDDYWRFSPSGLRQLARTTGLEVERVGHWGNRAAVRANLRNWAVYRPWHSLRNDPALPLVVWLIARRPRRG